MAMFLSECIRCLGASRILLLAAALQAGQVAAAGLQLVTENYPPYNFSSRDSRRIEGVSTDIVRELMSRAGQGYTLQLLPWQRAISLAEKRPQTCVFSMSRTPEREQRYRWIGPLVANDWVLFARSSDQRRLARLDDARPYRIGSYQGDAIVQYLRERNFDVDVAVSDDRNPPKLLARHIDLWATGRLIGLHMLQQQKIAGIEPVLIFHRTEMYLACSRQLPEALVDKLNLLLRQMENDGSIARVYARYGYTR